MQRTKGKIPVFLALLPVAACVILRFFQLLSFTDKDTGLLVDKDNLSPVLYILLAASAGISALCAGQRRDLKPIFQLEKGSRAYFFSSLFFAVAFFLDFVHRVYACYDYLSSVSYVEYIYLVPLALSGVLALVCSFYFAAAAQTARGSGYDFRNFTVMHFAPVLWCFDNLVMMMLKIIDVRLGVESVIEFLLLASMIMFFFCFISAIDKDGEVSGYFVFFALMTLSLSIVLALPRVMMLAVGKISLLSKVDYSLISYIAAGVFSAVLLKKTYKED